MNLQTSKVLVTDMLNCTSCKNIEICKIYQCLGNRTLNIVADSDCSDTIRTIMLCKHFVDNSAPVLHIKSTSEDFTTVKKLLNERSTGIEYWQKQPECAMKEDDRGTCSLPNCSECAAGFHSIVEEPCASCNGMSNFVKRS